MSDNFSDALVSWKDINLSELQKTLDAQGIELVENQKESMVGRKALADKTREFKKMPDEEKLNGFKSLLKAYQSEIDNLTRRTKTSETAFLNVYKILAEAPDPYPLLEATVDQTVKAAETRELESQVARLREENGELKRKVGEIAVLESGKRKAEARVETLEEKMNEMIAERVGQKENELNATYDEKLMNYEERERDLQRQLTLTKTQLRDLRTSNDSNQAKLLDHSQRADQQVVAKLVEMDMVVADLERANTRVAAVERRNEILRAEIEAVRSGNENDDRVKSLESQIAGLESETSRLLRNLEIQKTSYLESETIIRRKLDDTLKDLSLKTNEMDNLKQKLKQLSDYDEIKRELEIMKYVEFGDVEDDDSRDDIRLPDPNPSKSNNQHGKSLETLLGIKNRRLLEELTNLRVSHGELESSLHSITEELSQTRSDLDKQQVLNERLEIDLLQLHTTAPSSRLSPAPSEPDTDGGLASLGLGQKDPHLKPTPIPFTPSAETSILPIVTSQRDRFRQRNAELEEELRKQFRIISDLRTEIKSFQTDNLKLYEKVRYMQSYQDENAITGATSTLNPVVVGTGVPVGTIIPPNGTAEMGKYRNLYEQNMNPFEAFRGRVQSFFFTDEDKLKNLQEAARAVQGLNPIERAVLTLTRQILGNRRARTFFIFYAFALHSLVLFTLYECTSSPSSIPRVQH